MMSTTDQAPAEDQAEALERSLADLSLSSNCPPPAVEAPCGSRENPGTPRARSPLPDEPFFVTFPGEGVDPSSLVGKSLVNAYSSCNLPFAALFCSDGTRYQIHVEGFHRYPDEGDLASDLDGNEHFKSLMERFTPLNQRYGTSAAVHSIVVEDASFALCRGMRRVWGGRSEQTNKLVLGLKWEGEWSFCWGHGYEIDEDWADGESVCLYTSVPVDPYLVQFGLGEGEGGATEKEWLSDSSGGY
ncbi:hypothetical protein BCR35DRAFT_23360 [Leucosporidium creatinivorum]|uniref:Uncharacterized protein n=1 Tax=Leucosporidium creatinivorum TaxID=106004 RepID=A0A1Y2FWC0_9BASI|nr:hypothetical protein BCR35DRAFT_23360 [Leucosporidium creatinivorum]